MVWISTTNCFSLTPPNHHLILGKDRSKCKLLSSKCKLLSYGNRRRRSVKSAAATATATAAPWLMLPPVMEGGGMFYKFYSLEDDQLFTFKKRRSGGGDERIPPDDAKLVGSSHGWLALFDEKSNHVFLSNPIADRHIKLPAIDTLPDPHINLFEGRGSVSRVILSCSPDEKEKECYAMMTFGPGGRVAVCSPGISTGWEPWERPFQGYEPDYEHVKFAMRPHHDLVHCSSIGRDHFTTIQPCTFDLENGLFVRDKYGRAEKHCEMVHWAATRETCITGFDTDARIWKEEIANNNVEMLQTQCIQMPHIVCANHISNPNPNPNPNPLVVMRFLHRGIGDNGSPSDPKLARPDLYRAHINSFPYRSVRFLVLNADRRVFGWGCEVVEDLKGMAIFVGMNHSFAIPATGKLKPNSIYFTDAGRITPPDPDATKIYGGHDIGIYDYEKKTVSPCYYPCDFQSFKRIDPPPIWFTPNLPI